MMSPMEPSTLLELADTGRARARGGPFLTTWGGDSLSYDQAWAAAGRVAAALADAGARRGDRVAVQLPKSGLVVLIYLACIRSGLVLLPLNPAYTEAESDWIVGDADPALWLRQPGELAGAAAAGGADAWRDLPVHAGDLAALLYTSGTTGRPKGARLAHGALAANAAALHRAWAFRPGDRLSHALPLFHTHGLFVALNTSLLNGTEVILHDRFEPGPVSDSFAVASVFMGVPTFYSRLLAYPGFGAGDCGGMRLFTSGSAPLPASLHRQFQVRTGHAIVERYGLTETNIITSNPLGAPRAGTVGVPLADTLVRVVDPDDSGVGEVLVRGPGLYQGYWRRVGPGVDPSAGEEPAREESAREQSARDESARDESARDELEDGWFATGDLGRWDEEGYLVLVGRSKDLIITGGMNVYPSEVEEVLDALPGVEESAVIGVPDDDFGEVVLAVVVPRAGSEPDPDQLREAARARLAGYKLPKRVVLRSDLPRNAMGKVEKARLRHELGPRR